MINFPTRSKLGNPIDPWAIDPHGKDAFWSVVEDCLKEFHGFDPSRAHSHTISLRHKIESPPSGISGEMIYHDEPFYVACDIAGEHNPARKDEMLVLYRARYDSLLSQRNW